MLDYIKGCRYEVERGPQKNTKRDREIKKNKEDNATDISGALALASQIGRSQTDGSKYLVIFSDMFEYRYKELPVSKIDLTDFNILVVCGGFFNNEQDSTKLCMNTTFETSRNHQKEQEA